MSGNKVQEDEQLYSDALELVVEQQAASVSLLQRRFRIGYTKAAKLIDRLEAEGIIGPFKGGSPREILVKSAPGKKPKPKKAAAPKKEKKAAPKKCGAKKKGGGTCSQAAGWGTPHPGSGRCKLHGGSSTGPKSAEGKKKISENALKHGAYSDKILSDQERLLFDYLWESTVKKHGLDESDPIIQVTLQRACITYLKLIRLDEYEMEMEFIPNEMTKDPETGELSPYAMPTFDLDGNIDYDNTSTGRVAKLRWAKTPNWEGHFQKYMVMLGVDRGTQLKMDGLSGAAGQVVDAIGWLWGQKSQEEN